MCDTLCVLGAEGTLFAKNSDRPFTEAQVIEAHPRRRAAARLHTQYLEIPDGGAFATVLARPAWLWGAEHGVNEHGVAIGNEMVNTVDDPRAEPPALLGMDLVRLGLERAASADEALEVMTTLLERHGQGGVGDDVNDVSYWSSFLVADPAAAWVLETSGRAWAARPVEHGDAISNRLTLRSDWTRASAGVAPGTDLDSWRDPATPTGFADGRLAAGRDFVRRRLASSAASSGASSSVLSSVSSASASRSAGAREAVAHLRDHGTGPWGAPGSGADVVAAPTRVAADGSGVTVCMHIRDFEATTASMVAELTSERGDAGRAWMALGNPCASVFVPVLTPSPSSPQAQVPGALAEERSARRFAVLARAAERDVAVLEAVRAVFAPLEADLWDEADTLDADPGPWRAFVSSAERRVGDALDALARAGVGRSS